MSILNVVKAWFGKSSVAANNFTVRALDDGKLRVSRGNADAEIRDVLTIHADDALVARFTPGFSGLKASASGAGASIAVSADSLAVMSAGGMTRLLRNVALSINAAGAGANGLDAGTLAAGTWYALYVICKDDGSVAGLLSLSATSPTLPDGYTHFARVGWIRTDGTANKYPLGFTQYGRRVQYKLGGNLTALPLMASGAQGNVSTPIYVAVPVGAFVPPTAAAIRLAGMNGATSYGVAPNASYGAVSGLSATNYPPLGSNGTTAGVHTADLTLESSNIYYVAAGASASVACLGWEDNL